MHYHRKYAPAPAPAEAGSSDGGSLPLAQVLEPMVEHSPSSANPIAREDSAGLREQQRSDEAAGVQELEQQHADVEVVQLK